MIHIIGSGWYGCHIAQSLIDKGYPVEIWEKGNFIFCGASSKNQNRLHQGFHYPRSFKTRLQSKEGFDLFMSQYGHLTEDINNNFYALANQSFIDKGTYLSIFSYEDYEYEVVNIDNSNFSNIDLLIKTKERLIRHDLATSYWSGKNLPINFNSEVYYHNDLFLTSGTKISTKKDLIIDCSWGELINNNGFFEQYFVTYIIKIHDEFCFDAFTLMDGNFFSIFPYGNQEDGLFTLTHVKHGITKIPTMTEHERLAIYSRILLDVKKYLNIENIELVDSFISRKLKPLSLSDSREVSIEINDKRNFVRVYSGKIDTIFHAMDYLISELNL